MVGKKTARRGSFTRDDLRGTCDGATHVVQTATLGAFAMSTGAKAEGRTVAQLFGAGVGVTSSSRKSVHSTAGELSACGARAGETPPAGCDAVLRVELSPVAAPEPTIAVLTPAQVEPLRGKFCPDPAACRTRCEADDALACRDWAVVQVLGDRVARDLGAGTRAASRACELGEMTACTLLGIAYLTEGPKGDVVRGRALLERPCERGVAPACATLGTSFSNAGDPATAQRYFKRACDLGEQGACP
jgi:uncharacterized protein